VLVHQNDQHQHDDDVRDRGVEAEGLYGLIDERPMPGRPAPCSPEVATQRFVKATF
jgi:hypothetical protein